jgi:hypothetical protein
MTYLQRFSDIAHFICRFGVLRGGFVEISVDLFRCIFEAVIIEMSGCMQRQVFPLEHTLRFPWQQLSLQLPSAS